MQIHLTLGGALVRYRPPGATGNKTLIDCEEEMTLLALLHQLGIPEDQRLLVILNGDVVLKDAYANTPMSNEDKLSLMPPIQAG